MSFILGFILGIMFYVGYKAWRALRSDGWDQSNLFNFGRLEAFTATRPEQFNKMYYLSQEQVEKLIDFGWTNIDEQRPFSYIGGDEFSDHFPGSLR